MRPLSVLQKASWIAIYAISFFPIFFIFIFPAVLKFFYSTCESPLPIDEEPKYRLLLSLAEASIDSFLTKLLGFYLPKDKEFHSREGSAC